MPEFAYTAIEADTGRERHGSVFEASAEQAVAGLKARGWAPTGVFPKATTLAASVVSERTRAVRGRIFGSRRVTGGKGLTLFTRQLATLLKAGMPLLRALEVLARSERNPAFRALLEQLANAIGSGGNLSDGLRLHPQVFHELYLTMVRAGEAGGVLERVLDRLATFLERSERIKGRVKAAMSYPAVILMVASSILTGLMIFVVPKFQQIFSGVLKGQPLPALTRIVIGAADAVRQHLILALGLLGLFYLAQRLVRRSRVGARLLDRALLRIPLLGDLMLKAAIARFTRTFGSLLASGVPMLDALLLTRSASGNIHVAEALLAVHDRVKAGGTVAESVTAAAVFPGMVTSMIEVGEETGGLAEMLARIADAYDEEVDNAVAAMTSLIEPIMIVLMALVVGVIVIALFLPMVGVVQHLQ
jgi:type IV pilus assembly protein PilC